jgi:hypothetical protein
MPAGRNFASAGSLAPSPHASYPPLQSPYRLRRWPTCFRAFPRKIGF